MRAAPEVGEYGLWAGEGRLGVGHQARLPRGREMAIEGAAVVKAGLVAEELQPAGVVQLGEPGEEQAAEQGAEHPDRQKGSRP